MGQEYHRNWNEYLSLLYGRNRKFRTIAGTPVRIMKQIRWMSFGVSENGSGGLTAHPEEVWYRTSFDMQEPWQKISIPRANHLRLNVDDEKFNLYEMPLELDWKLKRDLHKMCQWLPQEYHGLYPPAGPKPADDSSEGTEEDSSSDE